MHLALLLLLAAIVSFHVPLTQALSDPFQEAEYASFGFLDRAGLSGPAPVLIHGGLDVLPSRLAASACPADAQIVCVRALNTLLQFVASCLFVGVLAILAGLGSRAALLATLPAAVMLWLFDGPTVQIVDAHQSSPGVRDLVVIAALLVMASICRGVDGGETRPNRSTLSVSGFLLGVLVGVGLFWAYNRGLVLILVNGAFTAGLCLIARSIRPAILVAAGAVVGLGGVLLVGGGPLMTETVFNILYWSRNDAIWRASFGAILIAPMFALGLVLFADAGPLAWDSLRKRYSGTALMIVCLLLTFGLYAVQSLNRPDLVHLRWAIWPAVLLLAIVIRGLAGGDATAPIASAMARIAALLLLSGAAIEFYSDSSIMRIVLQGLVENARAATQALPRDRDLAARDLVEVARLVSANGRCTFAANNAGMVHLLARVPPCSRFVFGTYVAADRQAEVIGDLQDGKPGIILWDSGSWWSNIDGRDLRNRTPVLADWIEANYPVRTVVGQYVLLSQAPLNR